MVSRCLMRIEGRRCIMFTEESSSSSCVVARRKVRLWLRERRGKKTSAQPVSPHPTYPYTRVLVLPRSGPFTCPTVMKRTASAFLPEPLAPPRAHRRPVSNRGCLLQCQRCSFAVCPPVSVRSALNHVQETGLGSTRGGCALTCPPILLTGCLT
jgi:hypothetical protein